MMNITETVKQLIIINVIFFLGTMFVPAAFNYLALWYFENPNFQFWQPLT
ncbi:MAG: rhomboid family intramembrane serine protease, partial [Flavobacterium sp.]|nr:rhomboid family intramembrane serine protease [Flavobacterium sp.]